MRITANRGTSALIAWVDIIFCVIVAADLTSKSKQSTPVKPSTTQGINSESPEQPDFEVDPQPWIDFLDLEGDTVVFPWQFEVRNIDRLLNRSEIEQVIVYLVIDSEIHGTGLIVASWQKRIVSNAKVDLPPGEYVATLKVASYVTGDLLGLESEPRILIIPQNTATDWYVQARALSSKVMAPGVITLVFYATVAELDDVERIASAWRGGALSVAIYLNFIDQNDIDKVISSVKAMHAKVEMLGCSALTVSFLYATGCRPTRESKCRGTFPVTQLINLAISVVETDLLLFVTTADWVSNSLVDASIDPSWIHRIRQIAMDGIALVVPMFRIEDVHSRMFDYLNDIPVERVQQMVTDENCTVSNQIDSGTLSRLITNVRTASYST
jgi:hypothetical protein